MVLDDEWTLPAPAESVSLNADELMLIDWCLCVYSHVLPVDLEDYQRWTPMREQVWSLLDELYNPESYGDPTKPTFKPDFLPFRLEVGEAEALLTLLPTTHRWGTGPDCGFSLKRKLSRLMRGISDEDGDQDQAQGDAESKPEDGAAA